MSGIVVFINLAGAVALLLWATRMVRTGIERAYGDFMRQQLKHWLGNRSYAAVAGFIMAIALQSSTAVALIVAGFAASGYVSTGIALASQLGGNLGSAVLVRILRHDLSLLIPVFFVFGTIAFRTSARRWREIGRILFGLGLLLLSLRLTGEASLPLKESRILPIIISYLSQDWITAFALAALIAWAFHSSVATILLFASLSDQALLPPVLAIPLVLGVNFGSAIVGAVLTRGDEPMARIAPLGNFVIYSAVMIGALLLQIAIRFDTTQYFEHPGDAVVALHIIANAAGLLMGLPVVMALSRLLERVLIKPASEAEKALEPVSALNPADLDSPPRALDNVTREIVGMSDRITLMLSRIFDVYENPSPQAIAQIEKLDDSVDLYNRHVKMYLAQISRNELDEQAARRHQDLLGITINLEQVGDIISQNMLAKARKKLFRNAAFSDEGWSELSAMYQRVLHNARLAFNLIVNRDLDHARQLVREKEIVREMVRESEEKHIRRLAGGNTASIETSSIHIDTMRDLKEINSLLVSIAYPVLSQAGLLRTSRLL
jgi:Na+/phosphate symporter